MIDIKTPCTILGDFSFFLGNRYETLRFYLNKEPFTGIICCLNPDKNCLDKANCVLLSCDCTVKIKIDNFIEKRTTTTGSPNGLNGEHNQGVSCMRSLVLRCITSRLI